MAVAVKPTMSASGQNRSSSCRRSGGIDRLSRASQLPPWPMEGDGAVLAEDTGPGCCVIPPTRYPACHTAGPQLMVSTYQHMGDRKTQEDRFRVAPCIESFDSKLCAFFGVFDGTVGDFASDTVKDLVIPKLKESPNFLALRSLSKASRNTAGDEDKLLEHAVRDMYSSTDNALLAACADAKQHYATCTGVTLLVLGNILVFGHVGDSRIVIGKEDGEGKLFGEQITMDHKPDQESERARIEQCGGMVERLQNHNNKPFIRGGDFMMRKALGEQPMQLQYSRAFGGKDLKMFGLSNVPDVRIIRMGSGSYRQVRWAILASDGLWDVLSAQQAVGFAEAALQNGQNPAEELVRKVLLEQSRRRARADNITAICVQFDDDYHVLSQAPPRASGDRPDRPERGGGNRTSLTGAVA